VRGIETMPKATKWQNKGGSASPFNYIPLILTFSHLGEGTLTQHVATNAKLST